MADYQDITRDLPVSKEAEQSILGCILVEPSCINLVSQYIKREYFAIPLGDGSAVTGAVTLYDKCCESHYYEVQLGGIEIYRIYHENHYEKAKHFSAGSGFSFMQVKTVQMGKYECYDKTNLFYKSLGFKELEVFPTLWDEANPCQIYIMAL